MSSTEAKIEFRLHGPGTFDDDRKDFRDGYAIERVERRVIAEFASREEAREFMLARAALGYPADVADV